ncbi:MAG: glycine cleavage system protein GcvH [Candidatus Marinimicrobia bacterium]|nr:glycine cleavage system protein GcvH [Candidatus Neomarinimicrobiota bacterium]
MSVKEDLFYTKEHEWIKVEDETGTIGITDYAQEELGDIVFVELPEEGEEVSKGDPIGTIEAVKTVSDIYSPVSGEVIEINNSLEDEAEKINEDPFGEGWIVKLKLNDKSEVDELLSAQEYTDLIE